MSLKVKNPFVQAHISHFTIKIGDIHENLYFFKRVLGMKVRRHEQYEIECGSCPGASLVWAGRTHMAYGFGDTNFAIVLSWCEANKPIKQRNDYVGFTIKSRDSIARAKALKWPVNTEDDINYFMLSPDGYKFILIDKPEPSDEDPILKVTLLSENIDKTASTYLYVFGIGLLETSDDRMLCSYGGKQVIIEFHKRDDIVEGNTYGRLVFTVPYPELKPLETRARDTNQTIFSPMKGITLRKNVTTSYVIILDPPYVLGESLCISNQTIYPSMKWKLPFTSSHHQKDGHEVAFGDETFKIIKSYDPLAEAYLYYCISKYGKK